MYYVLQFYLALQLCGTEAIVKGSYINVMLRNCYLCSTLSTTLLNRIELFDRGKPYKHFRISKSRNQESISCLKHLQAIVELCGAFFFFVIIIYFVDRTSPTAEATEQR